jgi:hypothetical protein
MLVIRDEQLAAFSEAGRKRFEAWMQAHLRRFFPRQCDALGDTKIEETIRYGIERAKSYGITVKRDVCKYLDLMVLFGRDFDTSPRLPWAGRILKGKASAAAKVEALHTAAKHQLRSS